MPIPFSAENLLFFAVVANALLLFILLLLASREAPAKRWLGWFVLALGIHLVGFRLVTTVYYTWPSFSLFSLSTVFAFGPLIYYYVLSLRGVRWTRRHAGLLIPLVLSLGYQLGKAGYIYWFDLGNRHFYYDAWNVPGVQVEFLVHDELAILFTGMRPSYTGFSGDCASNTQRS